LIMQPLVFISKIENGKTTCSQAIAAALRAFEGKWIAISIKERKRGRSNSQNRFYRGCVVPVIVELLREYGNDADCDIAHEFLKSSFLPPAGRKRVKVGKVIVESLSTTWLSTIDFEEYVERIRVFAAEHNYQINYPNEY